MSPADVDDLSMSEFDQMTAELDAYLRAKKKGAES